MKYIAMLHLQVSGPTLAYCWPTVYDGWANSKPTLTYLTVNIFAKKCVVS